MENKAMIAFAIGGLGAATRISAIDYNITNPQDAKYAFNDRLKQVSGIVMVGGLGVGSWMVLGKNRKYALIALGGILILGFSGAFGNIKGM